MVLRWRKTLENTLASECGRFSITKAQPVEIYPKPYALWLTPGGRVGNYPTSEAAKAAAILIAPTKAGGASPTPTSRGATNEHQT
jgi:hypothetical protein